MKYSGIDLHSNNSVVTVTDEEDRVVAEKRLPNDLAKILGLLEPWREEIVGVVVESTFNWYWLVDGLQAAGFQVHLAPIYYGAAPDTKNPAGAGFFVNRGLTPIILSDYSFLSSTAVCRHMRVTASGTNTRPQDRSTRGTRCGGTKFQSYGTGRQCSCDSDNTGCSCTTHSSYVTNCGSNGVYSLTCIGRQCTAVVRNIFTHRGLCGTCNHDSFGHARANRVILIRWQRDSRQNTNNRDNDHQFNEGKALLNLTHGISPLR